MVVLTLWGLGHPDWVKRLLLGLTMTNWFDPHYFFVWKTNEPLWSVPMEWMCYLILPPLMQVLRVFKSIQYSIIMSFIVFAVTVSAQYGFMRYWSTLPGDSNADPFQSLNWNWHGSHGPLAMIPIFILGVTARGAHMWFKQHFKGMMITRKTLIAEITCAFAIVGSLLALYPEILYLYPNILKAVIPKYTATTLIEVAYFQSIPYFFPWFPLSMALLIAACPFTRYIGPCLDIKPLKWFARISFGVYLWHYPILHGIEMYLSDLSLPSGIHVVTLGITSLAVSVALGEASWRLVEKPCINLAKSG